MEVGVPSVFFMVSDMPTLGGSALERRPAWSKSRPRAEFDNEEKQTSYVCALPQRSLHRVQQEEGWQLTNYKGERVKREMSPVIGISHPWERYKEVRNFLIEEYWSPESLPEGGYGNATLWVETR